jgi:hypothetical protein
LKQIVESAREALLVNGFDVFCLEWRATYNEAYRMTQMDQVSNFKTVAVHGVE